KKSAIASHTTNTRNHSAQPNNRPDNRGPTMTIVPEVPDSIQQKAALEKYFQETIENTKKSLIELSEYLEQKLKLTKQNKKRVAKKPEPENALQYATTVHTKLIAITKLKTADLQKLQAQWNFVLQNCSQPIVRQLTLACINTALVLQEMLEHQQKVPELFKKHQLKKHQLQEIEKIMKKTQNVKAVMMISQARIQMLDIDNDLKFTLEALKKSIEKIKKKNKAIEYADLGDLDGLIALGNTVIDELKDNEGKHAIIWKSVQQIAGLSKQMMQTKTRAEEKSEMAKEQLKKGDLTNVFLTLQKVSSFHNTAGDIRIAVNDIWEHMTASLQSVNVR
ncbi:MAG: hypothetical protein AAF320_04420, partial [Myxococcota bacterium]